MAQHEQIRYQERLLPRLPAIAVLIALIAMLAIAYGAAFGATLGWIAFGGLLVGAAVLVFRTAPRIVVTDATVSAGGARLPLASIGGVRELDSEAMRLARGPGTDARRYVVLRTWAASGGVLIELDDAQDPHPAWLVSSRRPRTLVGAIDLADRAG